MKEKVKIWSRRRLLGAFLAFVGLSAMATAQSLTNGTVHANCGTELSVVTRTLNQMDSTNGTVIPISFDVASNPGLIGDNYYIVAGTNGSLLSLEQTACDGIGDGLTFMGTSDASYTGTNNTTLAGAVGQIPANGKIYLRVKATTEGNVTGVYKLGIFVEDIAGDGHTNCYSDVHYITIKVFQNVYASLNLHNGAAQEYICSGTTTITDIGFDLCGIPTGISDFTLYYGLNIVASLGDATATGTSVTDPAANGVYSRNFTLDPNNGTYSMRIGTQTLTNTSDANINVVTYTFSEGLDKFYLKYQDGAGRTVQLPILFITNEDNCVGSTQNYTTDQLSHVFTVNLAPAFTIDALAYKTSDDRTSGSNATTEFCQGRIAYLNAVTSSQDGTMPNNAYSWTLTENIDGATNIENPKSKELVLAGDDTYTFTVTAQWDDNETAEGLASGNWATVNGGNGCKATDNVVIDVIAAPILHIATNENTEGDGIWNATDVITNAEVCSGDEIKILTADALGTIGTLRQDTLNTSIYIKTNGASIAYTIDPADNNALKAYSEWRSTPAATTGTLSIGNADGTTPGHYLNNETANNPAIITYIVENAGTTSNTCPLVRSDGTSLNLGEANEGKVRIEFPVKARPQFNLSAN